jgi:RimJ/RimL family protein N-acetyltransferase
MEGKLVRLRRYEPSDLDELMRFVNDEEVTRNLGSLLTLPVSRLAEEGFVENVSRGSHNDHEFATRHWAASTSEGADSIASTGSIVMPRPESSFGKKSIGAKGTAATQTMVLLRCAFRKMNLHRVFLRVYEDNERAIRSYEKCGFKREGVLRETRFIDGRYLNALVMGILAPEFGS